MLEDTLIAAAIGALAAIFLSAFIALLVVCHRQKQKKKTDWERFDKRNSRQQIGEPEASMPLGDFGFGHALDQIINDEQWVDDATGLIPHCLGILRICHQFTENVTTLALSPISKSSSESLIHIAKRIPYRIDRVVEAMYPPIDPRLLEERVTDLVNSVFDLGLIAQSVAKMKINWIHLRGNGQHELDGHLRFLRRASRRFDERKRNEFASQSAYV